MATAVDKALRVLDLLDGAPEGKPLIAISSAADLPKSTAHRLLQTLVMQGFAAKTPGGNYRIGPKLIALGASASQNDYFLVSVRPILRDLMNRCQETVQLGVLLNEQLLFLERMSPVNLAVQVGNLPSPLSELHTSAMGKSILAAKSPEYVQSYVQGGLKQYTVHTITDPPALLAELEKIRRRGYAVSNEERHDGVLAVGAAITNALGDPVAALSVAAPTMRVTDQTVELLAESTLASAAQISHLNMLSAGA
ncbi:IclR family transcriptional regulator [Glutamicibacter uratoxydans]|uniref:IclR family transcriptional regulator n=1 Tax=Glutamicibacter uratoxydans TaxID=43667 RepID=UPI003D6FA524